MICQQLNIKLHLWSDAEQSEPSVSVAQLMRVPTAQGQTLNTPIAYSSALPATGCALTGLDTKPSLAVLVVLWQLVPGPGLLCQPRIQSR